MQFILGAVLLLFLIVALQILSALGPDPSSHFGVEGLPTWGAADPR